MGGVPLEVAGAAESTLIGDLLQCTGRTTLTDNERGPVHATLLLVSWYIYGYDLLLQSALQIDQKLGG